MLKIRYTTQLAAALLASAGLALALGARADSGAYPGTKAAGSACESARLSAWFERQRQLTDGDTNPFVQAATPRECSMVVGANAAGEAAQEKQLVAVAKATQQAFPSGYEGVNLGGS